MRVIGDQHSLDFAIANMRDCVFVIDETVNRNRWRSLCKLMIARPNAYIICTREGTPNLPYGIDTTFEMVGGPTVYSMVPHYRKDICTRTIQGISGVVCEDSKSGFEYIRQLCNIIPVHSAEGKDKITEKLQNLLERQLVVFDTCGIGATMEDLLRVAKRERSILFDSRSFEHEVLDSLFCGAFTPYKESEDPYGYASEEEYYVATLNSVLSSPPFRIGYNKGNVQLFRIFMRKKGKVGGTYCDLSSYYRGDAIPYEEILEEDQRQGGNDNEHDEP